MKIPYEVIDRHADMIGGERVEKGIVNLSDTQAEHWLRMGAIRCLSKTFEPDEFSTEEPQSGIDVIDEATAGVTPRHPLDHDGDGRPGGSVKGARRRSRKFAQSADQA